MSYFNIPYVPFVSEEFKEERAIRDLDTKLSYTGMKKLNRFIKVHKDKLSNELQEVV